jgi:predicted RNase H-like HicB family nuclease
MRVTAKAQRSDGWWAVEVPEVPGVFTQARRLDQIPDMVRDAVALVSGEEAEEIEIVVDPHTDLDVVVAEALAARAAATQAQEAAMDAYRDAAKRLSDAGLTVRDSGQLLGVSPQRVSQILEEAITAVRAGNAARAASERVVEAVPTSGERVVKAAGGRQRATKAAARSAVTGRKIRPS